MKNGEEFGVKHLEYGYQENPVGGLADGLKVAENFSAGESIAFLLGDNTTDEDIGSTVRSFKHGAVMFLKKVPDPAQFGVPIFDKKDKKKIIGIIEKPKKPPSDYASAGIYIFDNRCFEIAKKLKPSTRGQLEITDVQNFYIQEGSMQWRELKGYWQDAGTFNTLFQANAYWAKKKGIKL